MAPPATCSGRQAYRVRTSERCRCRSDARICWRSCSGSASPVRRAQVPRTSWRATLHPRPGAAQPAHRPRSARGPQLFQRAAAADSNFAERTPDRRSYTLFISAISSHRGVHAGMIGEQCRSAGPMWRRTRLGSCAHYDGHVRLPALVRARIESPHPARTSGTRGAAVLDADERRAGSSLPSGYRSRLRHATRRSARWARPATRKPCDAVPTRQPVPGFPSGT